MATEQDQIVVDEKIYAGTKVVLAKFLTAFRAQPISSILFALKTRNRAYVLAMLERMEAEGFVTATGAGRNKRYSVSRDAALMINVRVSIESGEATRAEVKHAKKELPKQFWTDTGWVVEHVRKIA